MIPQVLYTTIPNHNFSAIASINTDTNANLPNAAPKCKQILQVNISTCIVHITWLSIVIILDIIDIHFLLGIMVSAITNKTKGISLWLDGLWCPSHSNHVIHEAQQPIILITLLCISRPCTAHSRKTIKAVQYYRYCLLF